jgi:hypothetical protein
MEKGVAHLEKKECWIRLETLVYLLRGWQRSESYGDENDADEREGTDNLSVNYIIKLIIFEMKSKGKMAEQTIQFQELAVACTLEAPAAWIWNLTIKMLIRIDQKEKEMHQGKCEKEGRRMRPIMAYIWAS